MLTKLCEKRNLMPIWENDISWEERRKQILNLLQKEEYGYFPDVYDMLTFKVVKEEDTFCAGKVNFKHVNVTAYWGKRAFSFPIYVSIPKKSGKHPFFVHINFRDSVPDRYLPIEEICDRGYAVISFCYQDVTMDDNSFQPRDRSNDKDLQDFLLKKKIKKPDDCGKIVLWAWAASRALDYAYTLDCLDLSRAAVVGHSRLGKTALLAGAMDARFTCAISNDSGCSGAAISRQKQGEHIKDIMEVFPRWFCENYWKYVDKEDELPFDQHFLVAAIAPRKVYVASAIEDEWADPVSEFLSCYAASEVYEKLGLKGLVSPNRLPEVGEFFHEGNIGYHLRKGTHYLSREDWNLFMDFC